MEFVKIIISVFLTVQLLAACSSTKVLSDSGLDRGNSGRIEKEYRHSYKGCNVLLTEYENFAEVSLDPSTCMKDHYIIISSKTKTEKITINKRFLFYKDDTVFYDYWEPGQSTPSLTHIKIWPFGVVK